MEQTQINVPNLTKLPDLIKSLMDGAQQNLRVGENEVLDAEDKITQAFDVLKVVPGFWRVQPEWDKARGVYIENLYLMTSELAKFGIGFKSYYYNP